MPSLSPLPIRFIAFTVLVLLGIVAIWFIDGRAMQRQTELEQQQQTLPHEINHAAPSQNE